MEAIAEKAQKENTGARGLRSIMENLLMDLMFKVPSDVTIEKVIISAETVKDPSVVTIIHNQERKLLTDDVSDRKEAKKKIKRSNAG